jgi:hypothetical protein
MVRPLTTSRFPVLLLAFSLTACVHATPVTPAALDEAEVPKLRAAIVSTCNVIATQKEGGNKKDADYLSVVFNADNTGKVLALGVVVPIKYSLQGRNVLMTGGVYQAFRMEESSGDTLKWFVYDISETWYCKKL